MNQLAEFKRCPWAAAKPLFYEYHDSEWGVPVVDDRKLFEFLVLEGAQAGLSWATILKRREGYRKAFANFDPESVASFGEDDIVRLLNDTGIIRNRQKVRSAINNARCFLNVQSEYGGFSEYQWDFVEGETIQNSWRFDHEIPTTTEISDSFSKDLKKRGFSFVGSTIIYAHMQATGLVNDHLTDCFRYGECAPAEKR